MNIKRKVRRAQAVSLAIVSLCISCLAGCKGVVSTNDSINDTALKVTIAPTISITAAPSPSVCTAGWQVLKSLTYTQPANAVAFLNPDFGITVGYAGEIHYSGDQGDSWPAAQNKTLCLFGIDIVNKDVAFACGNGKKVTKTIDGGKTWNTVTDFGGSEPAQCKLLSFIDENTGLIASEKMLAYTSDSGITWTKLTPPAEIMAIYLTTATTGYIIGKDKKLYITNDAGATWKAQDLNIEGFDEIAAIPRVCAFEIAEDGTGVLFYIKKGGMLQCFETADGALSWTKSKELNVADAVESPLLLNLSHDGHCLSVQSFKSGSAAIVVNNE